MKYAFIFLVLAAMFWRVSENTVDPDLWGHVLYGQRVAVRGAVERVEPFSWTAAGHRWINHELGAEWVMGQVHRVGGGEGLFFLMVFVGMGTFVAAIACGGGLRRGLSNGWSWGLGLLASRDIAYGFAMRPQIVSALFLVVLIALLQAHYRGRRYPLWGIPILFVLWINSHGGGLAGVVMVGVAALAGSLQYAVGTRRVWGIGRMAPLAGRGITLLWISFVVSVAALCVNPYGLSLPVWLFESVRFVRPEIVEWRPIELSFERLPYVGLVVLALAGWLLSRREKQAWVPAVCLFLAIAAARHQRHLPLFALSVVALLPDDLADAADRLKAHYRNLTACFRNVVVQRVVAIAMVLAGCGALLASATLGKTSPLTLEVPRSMYPLSAVEFMQAHGLGGNLVNDFNWGQLVLWELPACRVSFDGRLDTCYPRRVIEAHWRFYDGEPGWQTDLPLEQADLALLPTGGGAMGLLLRDYGWTLVYQDPLASVAAADPSRHAGLAGAAVILRGPEALVGRDPFPHQMSARAGH